MSLYSRALKHVDMKRVKKLHEQKLEENNNLKRLQEERLEYLRNLCSPEFSNWRYDLQEEPPKMVNGYHPDLVDGKKVAQRFNRLDPISAKAMPPTGNPHIDKKVRAAAKKPK